MSERVNYSPEVTQAVLGIPYQPDARPWQEAVAKPGTLQLRSIRTEAIHADVGTLMAENGMYASQISIADGPEIRSQLLESDPLRMRTVGRGLIRLHNAGRLSTAGKLHHPDMWPQVTGSELVNERPEDEESVALCLRAAGYLGVHPSIPEDWTTRKMLADAADYMRLYAPALPPQPGELSARELAALKQKTQRLITRYAAGRKEYIYSTVRRGKGNMERLYYHAEDFSDIVKGSVSRPRAYPQPCIL